jgi:hypothetical protein
LESDGSDLIAVADASNKIAVLHASQSSFRAVEAQEMLRRSLDKGCVSDWWYVNGSLYQVALQPIGHRSGTIVVGREIDYRTVHDMGRISASQVVLSYDRNLVASTLGPIEEQEAGKKLQNASSPRQIEIADDQFFVDSLELNKGPGPVARRCWICVLNLGDTYEPSGKSPERIPGTRARRLHLSKGRPWRR